MPKTKKQILKEILKNNPRINRDRVIAGCEMTERLRKNLARRRGYQIALPMTGKSIRGLDEETQDYRTIHLQQI